MTAHDWIQLALRFLVALVGVACVSWICGSCLGWLMRREDERAAAQILKMQQRFARRSKEWEPPEAA